MKIRLEREKDYYDVENLTREAFWNIYRPGCFEHFIIHKLRNEKCFVKELDYVIEENGKIISNIVYSKGILKLEDGVETELLTFGPVSVLPKFQKKGYGENLINFTLQKAKDLGYAAVVITGDPKYYKKYGFESCSLYDIYYTGMNKSEEFPYFMIKVLDKEKVIELKGIYKDPDCFNIDEKQLQEFDKKFPKKVKEIREGQLK